MQHSKMNLLALWLVICVKRWFPPRITPNRNEAGFRRGLTGTGTLLLGVLEVP